MISGAGSAYKAEAEHQVSHDDSNTKTNVERKPIRSAKRPPRSGPIAHPRYHVWLYTPMNVLRSRSVAGSATRAGTAVPNAAKTAPSRACTGRIVTNEVANAYNKKTTARDAKHTKIIGLLPTDQISGRQTVRSQSLRPPLPCILYRSERPVHLSGSHKERKLSR